MTDAEPERVEAAPPALAWTERLAAYAQHGPLPLVLLGLTVVTGVDDAVSYIALGHVFVANMTGNVVLLGFALAGAPGLSVSASLTAMGAFLAGAAMRRPRSCCWPPRSWPRSGPPSRSPARSGTP